MVLRKLQGFFFSSTLRTTFMMFFIQIMSVVILLANIYSRPVPLWYTKQESLSRCHGKGIVASFLISEGISLFHLPHTHAYFHTVYCRSVLESYL